EAFERLVKEVNFAIHDIGEEDVGALAAQLYGSRNERFGRVAQNLLTHRRGTCEGDLGDALAGGQGITGFLAVAVHHVDDTRGQQVADEFHEQQDAGGCLLCGLQHHGAAGSQRGGQLPGRHENREVPGNDLADHANGFLEVIGDRVGVEIGNRAFLSAQATGKVAEVVDGQGQVG